MTKIFNTIFRTDSLPVIGGGAGGATGAFLDSRVIEYLPSSEAIVITVILSAIGAIVGYLVKLLLDYLIKKSKKRN